MDVIDAISKTEVQKSTTSSEEETNEEVQESTKPVKEPVISNVTVDTNGVEYGEPETNDYFEFDAIFNMFLQNYMQASGSVSQ